jgi:hypothetical protein
MKRYGEITIEVGISINGATIEEVKKYINQALAAVNMRTSEFECKSTALTNAETWGEEEEQERLRYNAMEDKADARRKYGE